MLLCSSLAAQYIPIHAWRYRDELKKQVQRVWGIHYPVDVFAAQIHQESAWDPFAVSPYAKGLSQFTDSTAQWIEGLYPELIPLGGPFNSKWAMAAQVRYDKWLYDRTGGVDRDNHWAFVLASYNGGLGWAQRETKDAIRRVGCCSLAYFDCTKQSCLRLWANCEQTWDYVDKILFRWRPLYASW